MRSVFENSTTGISGSLRKAGSSATTPWWPCSATHPSRNWPHVIYPSGGSRRRDDGVHFRERLPGTEVGSLESAWIKRDGSKAFIRISGRAVKGDDGAILFYEGTVGDITALKQSDEELERKNDLIRMAGELASVGGWSVNLDENRTVWTDEAARIHEQPPVSAPPVDDALGFTTPSPAC